MDRKLSYSENIFKLIKIDFQEICTYNENIQFLIWNDIPMEYQHSYYINEQSINPTKIDFENWKKSLSKRPSPAYSVAILDNIIVSSVYTGNSGNDRLLNLWHTNENYRNQKIGKGVLLNSIINSFENNRGRIINAWDVTSKQVDDVLIEYGFN